MTPAGRLPVGDCPHTSAPLAGCEGAVMHRRFALAFALTITITTIGAAGYHLIATVKVPGDYGWDYAATDTDGRRLYVGHDEEVTVIDIDRDRVVGRIGGGSDMHGAAIAREFGRGFISESNPGSVVIFDLKTLQKISEVPVGKDPNLIMVDHKTGRVFTADRGDKQVSAID